MYCVYYFVSEIVRTNMTELKPSDESLKQGRNLDHGKLDSPLFKGYLSVYPLNSFESLILLNLYG